MLSDKQLDFIESEMAVYFQKLEQDVIKDIARRVKGAQRFTETAELQAESLQKLGYAPWKIKAEVFKNLKADKDYKEFLLKSTVDYKKSIEAKIKNTVEAAKLAGDELVANAGDMAFRNDVKFWNRKGKTLKKNGELDKTVRFYQKQMRKSVGKLTGSLAFSGLGNAKIENAYTEALNLGIVKVCSGAFTAETVTEEITKTLAKDGVYYVNYKSGAKRNLDTAIRLAMRTTSSQMAADIMMGNLKETGEDLVEVSHHAGARNVGFGPENHASWQGKVYSISGKPHKRLEKKLGYPIRKLSEATGYPDNPAGLCGYNCRHTFYPFFEGVSEPVEPEEEPPEIVWEGKKLDYYAARQEQRAQEREIRSLKRQIECGVKNLEGRLRLAETRYNNYIKIAGLKEHRGRLSVYSVAKKPRYIKSKALKIEPEKELPKTLINYAKHKTDWLNENIFSDLKPIEAQIEHDMRALFKNNNFCMRYRSKNIESLLELGRFMNQLETGTSGGTVSTVYRRAGSEKLFGTEAKGLPGKYFEKYGYLGYKDIGLDDFSGRHLEQYGDVTITFDKTKLNGRVTYTLDDSLGPALRDQVIAGDVNNPGLAGLHEYAIEDLESQAVSRDVFKKSIFGIRRDFDARYIELQYHGELTLDDVAQMAFRIRPADKVIDKLKKRGIKVLVRDAEDNWNEI